MATYYGGTGDDVNTDCAVAASGTSTVCGNTGPGSAHAVFSSALKPPANAGRSGTFDCYVLNSTPWGHAMGHVTFGGAVDDFAYGIATDAVARSTCAAARPRPTCRS